MAFVFDGPAVTTLAARCRAAAGHADDVRVQALRGLELAELDSDAPHRLATLADRWQDASAVLVAAVRTADGATIDAAALATQLGVDIAFLRRQLALAETADGTDPQQALGSVLATVLRLPTSTRQALPGLPPAGEDPELDEALARLDDWFLGIVVAGRTFDPAARSEQDRADLRLVAEALGGADVTVTVQRREQVRAGRDDFPTRTVERELSILAAGDPYVAGFVAAEIRRGIAVRETVVAIDRADRDLSGADLAALAAETGLPVEDMTRFADAVHSLNATAGGAADTGPAGRQDRPELTEAQIAARAQQIENLLRIREEQDRTYEENMDLIGDVVTVVGLSVAAVGAVASGPIFAGFASAIALSTAVFEVFDLTDGLWGGRQEEIDGLRAELDSLGWQTGGAFDDLDSTPFGTDFDFGEADEAGDGRDPDNPFGIDRLDDLEVTFDDPFDSPTGDPFRDAWDDVFGGFDDFDTDFDTDFTDDSDGSDEDTDADDDSAADDGSSGLSGEYDGTRSGPF